MSAKKKKIISECSMCECFILTKDSEKHKPFCGKEVKESPIQIISPNSLLIGITAAAVIDKRENYLPPDYFGWEKYENILIHPETLSTLNILPRSAVLYKFDENDGEERIGVVWPCDELPQMRASLINIPGERKIFIFPVKSSTITDAIILHPHDINESLLKSSSFVSYLQMYLSNAFLITESTISIKYFGETITFKVNESLVSKISGLSIDGDDKSKEICITKLTSLPKICFDPEFSSQKEATPAKNVKCDKTCAPAINSSEPKQEKNIQRALINPDWDFQKIGIGGLDKEFADIFRRAFASRVFPPEYSEQLGIKHVRGILLFGPPGTGKTLIARQMGKMLNAREPKIVNGPELLNKYVGESEANMRKLFADAEEEYKRCGANSGLHMIIFDEIDAICKQRGSQAGSSGVHDTMVNQLLTKLDGVEQLNNILVIGMTNRKDMIDEALLRPGRMEVQLEISLPDENGRVQILKIHTARMQEFNYLANDVDLPEIARRTKNFSGAEIEGLVRASQSSAMNRLIKVGSKVEIDHDAIDKLKITMDDFDYALEHDIKPAYGTADDILETFLRRGLVRWKNEIDEILNIGELLARETTNLGNPGFTKALFYGAPNTGKTYLVSRIAKDANFPFIKVITPQKMIGFSETAKCQIINKMFNDAYKSPLSILIIDELERLMDYTQIGPTFSNLVLQALLILLNQQPPKGHRLLVLATSSCMHFLQEVELSSRFSKSIFVPQLQTIKEFTDVAEESGLFTNDELGWIRLQLGKIERLPSIGIKTVLQFLDYARASDEPPKTFVSQIEDVLNF